ncbi:MAG: DsrE family protein [Nitrospirae bacterium]|nr:DsrE family protein [Nitrospirota bacterium]
MKLGILVNTDRYPGEIAGITTAAVSKGHSVGIFVMDAGTRLLRNALFTELCRINDVEISYCDMNAKMEGVDTEGLPEKIKRGSQYDNSRMVHESDKIIIL